MPRAARRGLGRSAVGCEAPVRRGGRPLPGEGVRGVGVAGAESRAAEGAAPASPSRPGRGRRRQPGPVRVTEAQVRQDPAGHGPLRQRGGEAGRRPLTGRAAGAQPVGDLPDDLAVVDQEQLVLVGAVSRGARGPLQGGERTRPPPRTRPAAPEGPGAAAPACGPWPGPPNAVRTGVGARAACPGGKRRCWRNPHVRRVPRGRRLMPIGRSTVSCRTWTPRSGAARRAGPGRWEPARWGPGRAGATCGGAPRVSRSSPPAAAPRSGPARPR